MEGLEPTADRLTADCSTIELYLHIGAVYVLPRFDNISATTFRTFNVFQQSIFGSYAYPTLTAFNAYDL